MTAAEALFGRVPVETLLGLVLVVAGGSLLGFAIAAWRGRGPRDGCFLSLLRQLVVLYLRAWHGARRLPEDPLPAQGPALLIANHRSGLDPALLAAQTRRRIRFLMAREYYEIPWLRWLFRSLESIPVRRDGNDLTAAKQALKALRAGQVIGIFPEGGIRETFSEEDLLGESEGTFKHGAAMLALKTGVPVLPAYIVGTPHSDSVLASYLTPSRSRVVFGRPLPLVGGPVRSPSKDDLQNASRTIVRRISELKAQLDGDVDRTGAPATEPVGSDRS